MYMWRVCDIVYFSCVAMLSQKIPKTVAESVELQNNGNVGVHLGETGRVTTVPYTTATDDRPCRSRLASMEGVPSDKDLEVGQAILITMRNNDIRNLEIMLVITTI